MTTEILDWESALEQLGGSADLLLAVTETLLESVPGLLEQIKTSAETGNAIELRRAAHTLKGSVAVFCAGPAHDASLKLEELAKAGRIDEATALIPAVERETARLVNALKERRK